ASLCYALVGNRNDTARPSTSAARTEPVSAAGDRRYTRIGGHLTVTTDDLSLQRFAAIDGGEDTARYVAALEAFDAIGQLQDLKRIERRRSGRVTGCAVLDIGCGFGLETLRLAKRAGPSGRTTGMDKSARFIAEAR